MWFLGIASLFFYSSLILCLVMGHDFALRSLLLLGPSPALSPMLMTRAAAKGSIGLGLLVFQVGSAMATVPAFTVMQASFRFSHFMVYFFRLFIWYASKK